MSGDDKKFFRAEIIKYSPTVFQAKMPVIKVRFESLPLPVLALVDSGASNSMIHKQVASQVGMKVDWKNKFTGTGAGGGFVYYKSEPLEVEMFGNKYILSFNIPDDENFAWGCILGQDTIFRLAKVTFKRYREEFEISFRKDIN